MTSILTFLDKNGLFENRLWAERVRWQVLEEPILLVRPQRLKDLGGIAQLVERLVRNEKVRGSTPLTSKSRKLSGLSRRNSLEANIFVLPQRASTRHLRTQQFQRPNKGLTKSTERD
jgi:hypothetical protein